MNRRKSIRKLEMTRPRLNAVRFTGHNSWSSRVPQRKLILVPQANRKEKKKPIPQITIKALII
jgi:hypothetical protein